MEIRQLKFFLEIIRQENTTKASDILHITQPALSRALVQQIPFTIPTENLYGRKMRYRYGGLLTKPKKIELKKLWLCVRVCNGGKMAPSREYLVLGHVWWR